MYSTEIEALLKANNYELTPEQCEQVMDVNTNSQIVNMKYFCADNEYHIVTDDGYYFKFTVKTDE